MFAIINYVDEKYLTHDPPGPWWYFCVYFTENTYVSIFTIRSRRSPEWEPPILFVKCEAWIIEIGGAVQTFI